MQMTSEILELWLATLPEEEVAGWRERLADPAVRARWFVAMQDGKVCGFTWLFDTGPRRLGVVVPRTPDKALGAVVSALLDEVVPAAREAGAEELGLRLPADRQATELLRAVARTGGVEVRGRIEFRTELDALPGELESPLVWSDAEPAEAAALLEACSEGTLDGLEPGEEALEVVRSWLQDEGRVAVHAATLQDQPVAVVCARVIPEEGWGTLTFMGLAPAARGRGLGHAVHRHGLALLRTLGGRLYHGGTGLDNVAMRACFVRQGCREHQRFRQFRWDLRPATAQ
jgi:GNAT superfamily N-acetyltransferase